ncbi:MAG: cob(I)yrinic acid a,c-diamide adenosyltransferase [Gammaproteobacteria bacterium]|nr:cob(I)yrinic acid a,c-diamide adenosyltransferase [Gammaproteobacteria bacterium]NIN62045.1 cob(I)yrinic acid a,c-diamide adenosyltransferase [Gammaproteobacteria bacterium]NIO62124.1 cob(I)yrinic acid a,c-diamide adenosyltransferase [Gammaproteobacteria bacterium]NIQ19836.1 cob(I)yrinic acid a,c-diamide adenosyltransferase [Gammaproteobacteria bacterium]NIT05874.1 cob(I)yrinic acid a,c-diamide adenosyltransferase [Gammaproteobacteria bacterium]
MGKRLTKIYTRTGDDGTTGLGNGERADKDSPRITVLGDIDELNSLLGTLIASGVKDDLAGYLLNIQHRLFDIGAEISVPGNATTSAAHITRLEELIDNYNEDLAPLEEFILPGGTVSASLCHLCRSVCRRMERHLVGMARKEFVNQNTLIFINRLSDLLFVFARVINQEKKGKEVYWDKDRLKRSV